MTTKTNTRLDYYEKRIIILSNPVNVNDYHICTKKNQHWSMKYNTKDKISYKIGRKYETIRQVRYKKGRDLKVNKHDKT